MENDQQLRMMERDANFLLLHITGCGLTLSGWTAAECQISEDNLSKDDPAHRACTANASTRLRTTEVMVRWAGGGRARPVGV
jgi:hypothetical protein